MYILLKFNSTVYIKENGLFISSLHMLALNKKFDLKSAFLLYEIDRGMILMKNLYGKTPMNVSTVSICMNVCMYECIYLNLYIFIYLYVHVVIYTYIYECLCIQILMYMLQVYIYKYIQIFIYHIHTHR